MTQFVFGAVSGIGEARVVAANGRRLRFDVMACAIIRGDDGRGERDGLEAAGDIGAGG